MKRNLLVTTAAAALLASGGMWAQAQAPGPKQDEKAQIHQQKGASAEKQNRGDESRSIGTVLNRSKALSKRRTDSRSGTLTIQ